MNSRNLGPSPASLKAVVLDPTLLHEAVEMTDRDAATPRTPIDEDRLMDGFVAEFVAESESLEGHDTSAVEVLDSARDLALP